MVCGANRLKICSIPYKEITKVRDVFRYFGLHAKYNGFDNFICYCKRFRSLMNHVLTSAGMESHRSLGICLMRAAVWTSGAGGAGTLGCVDTEETAG